MKKAFLDTNLVIANVFCFNSLHLKSEIVFNEYSELFWSNFVKKEFDERYYDKKHNVSQFFRDLQMMLENPKQDLYSPSNLTNFAKKNYIGRKMNDAKSSVYPFWDTYFGIETQIPFNNMKNAFEFCLKDLSINLTQNKQNVERILNLTPPRTNKYLEIDRMLEFEGVHEEDRIVTLDGHDFACRSDDLIDFVTFDDDCLNGAKKIDSLYFNSIKGKDDFKAS